MPAPATASGAPEAAALGAFVPMPQPTLRPAARSYAYDAATGCWSCSALSYVSFFKQALLAEHMCLCHRFVVFTTGGVLAHGC